MDPLVANRRTFLANASGLLGASALCTLESEAAAPNNAVRHFAPTAKQVIYLFMSGGPSHVDTFDPKPELNRRHQQPAPDSLVDGIHFAMIPSNSRPKLYGSPFRFAQYGQSGIEVSELFPHVASVIDRLAIIRSVHSPIFNHDPAVNLLNTGDARVGRPTMGAWLSYGLGNLSDEFPAYVVLTSGVKRQPLLTSYWTSGFLPTEHQGVELRNSGDPILFLSNPSNVTRHQRSQQLALIQQMNRLKLAQVRDPETATRIKQYELAFRMQASAPALVDLSKETRQTLEAYGAEQNRPSFARNCLLARRMVESGIRFVQLYDMGWDSHGKLQAEHPRQCKAVDQPIAALINDLAVRGLLDETLVIWGGEFGRTPVVQGSGKDWGRDHHPHGFTMWMAGGGVKPGVVHGSTDEFGFYAQQAKVDVHDLHATVLHLLGIDHKRLTYRHQGRNFRLTDVSGNVVREILR